MEEEHVGWVKEINIVRMEKGLFSSILGEAHQHIVAGVLLWLGFFIAAAPIRTGAYDLILIAYTDREKSPKETRLLRVQCKTVKENLRLIGGVRAGIDRDYLRPSPKEYKYTEEHNDLIIGVDMDTLDLYVVPTRFLNLWGKSVSKRRIQLLKNNFNILLNWRDDYLDEIRSWLLSKKEKEK